VTDTLHTTLATPGWDRDPAVLEGGLVIAAAGVFWLLGGPLGAGLALGVGVTAFALPPVVVFALAQVALAVLLPDAPALGTVVVGELPLLGLLGLTVDRGMSRRQFGAALLLGGGLVGVTVGAVALAPRQWLATVVTLGAVALPLYGIHRYAVVRYTTHE